MFLYGSIKKSVYTFGKWYLETPDIWCKDKIYIKKHPFPSISDTSWRKTNLSDFLFFKTKIDCMDYKKVFDLRGSSWKDKLHIFISWYGNGWISKGGIDVDTSPIEHIKFLGNYHILASAGYRWVVFNHISRRTGKLVELWFYANTQDDPNRYYEIKAMEATEFFR